MPGIFRSSNPFNVILVFFLGFLLRYDAFVHPVFPVVSTADGFLYHWIVAFLTRISGPSALLFSALAYLLVFIQATMLNAFVNNHRMFGKVNYLTAFSFITITAIRPEWWQFSSLLLVNTAFIPVWNNLVALYKSQQAKSILFSTGILVGLSSFVYFPAIGYVLLLMVSVLIMRPFQLPEWVTGLIGLLVPYYFLFSITYLAGTWDAARYLPSYDWGMVLPEKNVWTFLSLVLLLVPLMLGFYYLQESINRLAINSRKAWNLVFYYLVLSLLIPFLSPTKDLTYFFLATPAIAAVHANVYAHPRKAFIPNLLLLAVIGYVLVLNFR